jgi:hypothetical protein
MIFMYRSNAVIYVLFKLPTLLVGQLFEIEFKCLAIALKDFFNDVVYAHKLLRIEEVDVVAKCLPFCNSHGLDGHLLLLNRRGLWVSLRLHLC